MNNSMCSKKLKNIEDVYTREEFAMAVKIRNTYYPSYAPVVLCAEKNTLARYRKGEECFTLKMWYAIQVWRYVIADLEKKYKGILSVEWENTKPFRSLKYVNNQNWDYARITEEIWNGLKTVAQSGKINVCAGTFCNYRQSNWDCINNENSDSGFVITKIYDVSQLPKKYPTSDPIGIYIKKFYWPEIRDLFVEVPIRVQELIHGENLNPLHPESHLTLAGKLFKGKNIWRDFPEITLDEIKEAVEVCHCDVNETYGVDCKGFGVGATPLLMFTWLLEGAERLQIIEYLVNKGADVNFFGYGGRPVLGEAVLFCDVELVKFLLEHGANPNYNGYLYDIVHRWVFDYKSLPLHYAYNLQYFTEDDIPAKAKEIFDLLIQHGAEMFVEDIDKNNELVKKILNDCDTVRRTKILHSIGG